jgi:pilus assembly protein CpaB
MKSKAIPHMILAVILALVAGGLTIRWLASFRGQAGPAKPAPVTRKVEALVASRPIPKGARLDAGMVRLKGFEADAVPTGALRETADAVGRITAREISQDDPITPDKLLPKGATGGGLEAAVEPGKRALTVKGTKIMGSGGHIAPGSRVDVLVTYSQPGKTDAKINKIILENVLVLTAGAELEARVGKDGREELANTDFFTLMVTPEEAERLALAADLGSMHLALRKPGDTDVVQTPGADVERSLGAFSAAPAEAAAAPEPEPGPEGAGYTVEIIRGTERERVNLDSLSAPPAKENPHGQP